MLSVWLKPARGLNSYRAKRKNDLGIELQDLAKLWKKGNESLAVHYDLTYVFKDFYSG